MNETHTTPRQSAPSKGSSVVWGLLLAVLLGGGLLWVALSRQRGASVPVTQQRIQAARQQWDQRGVLNYRLKIELYGDLTGTLRLSVRDGTLQLASEPPPLLEELDPSEDSAEAWTVEGMFERVIRDLEIVENPSVTAPLGMFGPAQGNKALRVDFDPAYGYVKRYKRPTLGALAALEWRVVRFAVE